MAALEALLRAWLEYVPRSSRWPTTLEAAVITDDDAADAWRDRMGELREAFRFAIERVAARRRARADGWTVDAAADWVWARCQPSNRATWSSSAAGSPPSTPSGPSLDPREILIRVDRMFSSY